VTEMSDDDQPFAVHHTRGRRHLRCHAAAKPHSRAAP
jgi:hypothetical protein